MNHQGDIRHGIVNPAGRPLSGWASDPLVYRAFCNEGENAVVLRKRGSTLLADAGQGLNAVFRLVPDNLHAQIELLEISNSPDRAWRLPSAAFEYLFATLPSLQSLSLSGQSWSPLLGELNRNGIWFSRAKEMQHVLMGEMFWQTSRLWSPSLTSVFPHHGVFDGKIAHPLRPPKPSGTVYARQIPWLDGVFSLDVATLDDLPLVHRWMNDPRVNEFWHEAGDEDRHRKYLEGMFADPHIMPLIGRFDNRAFAYFEVYWAKEDIVGTFCDAGDYDRGCHVIVGEENCRGRDWFTAWLPSLLHFMFLDDPRTQRIVQEPSSGHHRQLRNLQKSGFSHIRSVDLPTKHAAIMAISRQRFFADRLWHPAA
jgi:RimJ/RimL family protein N-acetyltransferase